MQNYRLIFGTDKDPEKIMSYGVMKIPALAVDDKAAHIEHLLRKQGAITVA